MNVFSQYLHWKSVTESKSFVGLFAGLFPLKLTVAEFFIAFLGLAGLRRAFPEGFLLGVANLIGDEATTPGSDNLIFGI